MALARNMDGCGGVEAGEFRGWESGWGGGVVCGAAAGGLVRWCGQLVTSDACSARVRPGAW